jgi:hypothetical protein
MVDRPIQVTCRDCGHLGEEEPDDPAPNLCPTCYEARLERITPLFEKAVASLQHPVLVALWLEDALHDIGGEKLDYAHRHAMQLLAEAMRKARGS